MNTKVKDRLCLIRQLLSFSSSCSVSLLVVILFLCAAVQYGTCQVLTPPYFNLAENRPVNATATCGENGIEEYCKLVGASADTDINIDIRRGQACDYCDANEAGKAHPAIYAVDGSERWWQSPPLSSGLQYEKVNLTIDLGQEFHVAYVFITMANSPRPAVWILERSKDYGKTYEPWQYFADSPGECERLFGAESLKGITKDNSVICDTTHSKVLPFEGGEIVVSLLNNRPSATDFFSSEVLQEWTRATNIRLALLRTKTLLGHLMSVRERDPTVTRRYFYSIKDISVGGRCRCNGHADLCDKLDPNNALKLLCRCQHNTCGDQCEQCCPGFKQKQWKTATYTHPFVCEPCNCFGHSNECEYSEEVERNRLSLNIEGHYEGGGVCQNCRDNTEGINCNKCKAGFFRPYGKPLNATDACQPCDCDPFYSTGNCEEGSGRCECKANYLSPDCDQCSEGYYDYPTCRPCDCNSNGTRGGICEVGGGQCPCKNNFAGKNCEQCAEGFYNFPECLPCECEDSSSVSPVCNPEDGQCECENKYGGRTCAQCEDGYYDFPDCQYCNCDTQGTREGICDKSSGTCLCRDGYGGPRCDQCLPGYYGYPDCRQCNCSAVGSASTVCDATGKCPCLPNFSGRACDQCRAGFYKYPDCLACECDTDGSMGVSCDDEGKCQCKPNFDGQRCTECREGFYIFPQCEECNCDPAGVIEEFRGCGDTRPGELCECKPRVQGRICNECKPLFWNLQQSNPLGCEDCECHIPGVLGGVQVCEGKSGQCPCKTNVGSRQCQTCSDGYFNLTMGNLLGCDDCSCDVGGAMHKVCDKITGQCRCRPRIDGLKCEKPLKNHYFPTLHQYQFEAEDGLTPSGGPVRFAYDDSVFPDYSWRGYAVYSQLQPQTHHEVYIEKSSLYRMVLRYINPGDQTISGEIVAIPDNPKDDEFRYKVKFDPKPGHKPAFLTVSQAGNVPAPFVLNTGRWRFDIKNSQYLLIDYFVLLPEAYYEGSILQTPVSEPCMLNTTNTRKKENLIIPDECVLYTYPPLIRFDSVLGTDSYVKEGEDRSDPRIFYSDHNVLKALNLPSDRLVVLSPQQREIEFDLNVAKGGRYALVLEYFTPRGANVTKVEVETTSKKGTTKGQAHLYNCKHATPCRQVLTTPDGEVAVFRFDQSTINLKLGVPENITDRIAVNRVAAIPLGKWSLDYIRPMAYCVMKNGTCAQTNYELPPDSVKVEAEVNAPDRVLDESMLPPGVSNKSVIILDDASRTIEINGRVPYPGYYTFLVHYLQPENPDFSMEVLIQNGQHYEAHAPISYCPSTAGCRSVVNQEDKNNKFYLDSNFDLTLKSPKSVYIDYIVAVPASVEDYDTSGQVSQYLAPLPLDQTARFITECGKNHMYLPSNTSDFCRESVFSITAEYNDGALPCQCDVLGSLDFECDQFGGQCNCKRDIIGRRCERCKTGYYNFPNCEACNCPSTALCDPETGECICPPRVTGEKCDTCEPYTYGFDPLIGCEECACSPLGVEGGNLQCDLLNGSCPCRPNIIGRTCDRCTPGYWAFPYCQLCGCDLRGTTSDICHQDTAECFCKQNVEGRNCDTCKVGSFNLQERNPQGCTKCFCFGKTTRCSSANLFWTVVTARKQDITSVIVDPLHNQVIELVSPEVEFEDTSAGSGEFTPSYLPEDTIPPGNESSILYFKIALPSNHLASYGGKLTYEVVSDPEESEDRESLSGPDVILEGQELAPSSNLIRLMHYAVDHVDGDNAMKMSLEITEENFMVPSPTGGLVAATRDQVMVVLKELRAIYVRAAYWKRTREVKLSSFGLEIGSDQFAPDDYNSALTVEQCQCPPNYQGLSCEECAPGYYRSTAGPFGGFCVPCQCNGHSDRCDPVSGVCLDCQHNTIGEHCEMCDVGYHGDATGGTPFDCLICACPLPLESNNFATSCELSQDGSEISCTCKEGYFGLRCESCAPGHYGRPEVMGEYCRPCDCSNNIDVTDPRACDTVTGNCLVCMNHTAGEKCDLCEPFFYGDAVDAKDCRKCPCNECGTQHCNHRTGDCQCLPNVIGLNCDRCRPDHYGMSHCNGTGCMSCECGPASESTQCNDLTGQCECKRGVTGRRCDRCAPGYYNYSEDGCIPCECNQDYAIGVGCDPQTGQCSCLPGVVGEKCDRCPYRWVLIENFGCQECESCHHQLLDSTDAMAALLDPVKLEFDNVAVSYFTTQRLSYFNNTAAMLEPLIPRGQAGVDLGPFSSAVEMLEQDSKSSKQKVDTNTASLRQKTKASEKLREKSVEVEAKVQEAVAKAKMAVFETQDLMKGLVPDEKISSPQVDAARTEAQAIVDNLNNVLFNASEVEQEQNNAEKALRDIKDYVAPVKLIIAEVRKDSEKMAQIKNKLKDIRNQTDYSLQTARKANAISKEIRDAKYPSKIDLLEDKADSMTENLDNATATNELTEPIINDLDNSLTALDTVYTKVRELHDPLEENSEKLRDELQNNRNTIRESQEHVQRLRQEARRLEGQLDDTKAKSNKSISAATAYQNIIDALDDALREAEQAESNTQNATEMVREVEELSRGAQEPSTNLLALAKQSETNVDEMLRIPLGDAKHDISRISNSTEQTSAALNNIDKALDRLSQVGDPQEVENSRERSSEAIERARDALESVDSILQDLPRDTERAHKLPITVSDLNEGVKVSDRQLNQARDSIPLSEAISESLQTKKPELDEQKVDIATKLDDLRAKVAAAREQANRVPVGVNLDQQSLLLLDNPQSLDSQQTQTKLSVHFKTPEPDGLILYLGNEEGRKGEEDFLALEVDGGYPVLTMDLGSGPQKIRNPKYVADDQWHKATVDRVGKTVRFTISEEDQNQQITEFPSEGYIQGPKSLFNVDRNSSKLYVGGIPPEEVKSPVRHTSFRGVIEDLVIGDEKVGLWNFKEGQSLNPAYERDRFVDLRPQTGLRFQGNGYAILDRTPYRFKEQSAIRLSFQTRSPTGLLFLVGRGRKYLSLELRDGKLVFEFDLGSGPATIQTINSYNDGRWHQVDAVRSRNTGALHVDNIGKGQASSPGSQTSLGVSEFMYFGGYPGQHSYPTVTQRAFEGCIDNVTVDEKPVDLTQAVETRYTLVGCPSAQFDQVIATFGDSGYVQLSPADIPRTPEETFELNMRVKTNDSEGLVFYGANADQSSVLSVSLFDGSLYVQTEPGGTQVRTDPINDANWHVVTVTKDRNKLHVNVDDDLNYMEEDGAGPVYITDSGSQLYFGGHPPDYTIRSDSVKVDSGYSGCLGDINVNGKRINFTNAVVKDSSISPKCLAGVPSELLVAEEIGGTSRIIPQEEEEGGAAPPVRQETTTTTTTTTTEAPPPPPPAPEVRNVTEVIYEEEVEYVEEPEPTEPAKRPAEPTKPTPTPFQQCALPYREFEESTEPVSLEEGVRFGNYEKTSRMEFTVTDSDKTRSIYSIQFKTSAPDGLIFFRSDFVKADFVALFMKKGYLHFAFDSGSGAAFLNSTKTLNDSNWHTAEFTRNLNQGELIVDGVPMATGTSPGSTTDINAGNTLYVGGLPPNAWGKHLTARKLLSVDSAFRGCLKNFLIRDRPPGPPTVAYSVEPCRDDVEPGYFFYPNSGYLKLGNRFQVGLNIKISLSIKPRHPSGLILAVHGNKDYIVLQMINGTVKFTVNNGHGPFSSTFSASGPFDLCDGNWHTIVATKKKHVATLAIDSEHANVGLGVLKSQATDTQHPLYLGGQPNPNAPGVETSEQFVGCIKDFVIQGRKPFKFSYESIQGRVAVHSCPVD